MLAYTCIGLFVIHRNASAKEAIWVGAVQIRGRVCGVRCGDRTKTTTTIPPLLLTSFINSKPE